MSESIVWDEASVEQGKIFLGHQFDGQYVEMKTEVGQNKSNLYMIKLSDGRLVSLWATAIIDDQFQRGNDYQPIPIGSMVRIVYKGQKPSSRGVGKFYHDVEVQFDDRPQFRSASDVEQGRATAPAPLNEPASPTAFKKPPAPAPQSQAEDEGY